MSGVILKLLGSAHGIRLLKRPNGLNGLKSRRIPHPPKKNSTVPMGPAARRASVCFNADLETRTRSNDILNTTASVDFSEYSFRNMKLTTHFHLLKLFLPARPNVHLLCEGAQMNVFPHSGAVAESQLNRTPCRNKATCREKSYWMIVSRS